MIFAFRQAHPTQSTQERRARKAGAASSEEIELPESGPKSKVTTNSGIWMICAALFVLLLFLAVQQEHLTAGNIPLLVFLTGIAVSTVFLPASGPRGQRVGMLPCVGLAATLLLSPFTATLPILLANALYAVSRDSSATRRNALQRGTWLLMAIISGGFCYHMLTKWEHLHLFMGMALASFLYGVVYISGRQVGLQRPGSQTRGVRRRAWAGWRLEGMTLIISSPIAASMACLYPRLGLSGVVASFALMGLLLLIAHFGFEVALLRDQVRAMERISAVTLSQTNPQRVIEKFLQLSSALIPCDRAAIWLTDDSQTRLERMATHRLFSSSPQDGKSRDVRRENHGTVVRFGEGLVGRVADRKSPLILRDGAADPRAASAEHLEQNDKAFSLLLLPLVVGGETVGVAQFERDAPGIYMQRDAARITALASQTAATIANVRMHQAVYNQAVTDELTGLFNRRHMQSALIDERRRAKRYGHRLSIIMLDVDGFKNYNDTYGHPQGDVLLKMLSRLLSNSVRSVDIVGRYGGEEFLILMPETSKEEAWRTAERLRLAVATAIFPGNPEDPEDTVVKTISLGVATFPEDSEDIQVLVQRADQALYRAKHNGRNQIVVAGAPLGASLATR